MTRAWTYRAVPLATTFAILACAFAPHVAIPAAAAVGATAAAIVAIAATIRSGLLAARASMATTRSLARTIEAAAQPGKRPLPAWLIVLTTAVVTAGLVLLIVWISRPESKRPARSTA